MNNEAERIFDVLQDISHNDALLYLQFKKNIEEAG